MSEATVSRGGWNVKHLRHGDHGSGPASSATRSERRRLLKEAMRSLDPGDTARQAKRNISIVEADTHLNRAYVNDGAGGFRELTPEEGVEPVLAYGDARIDAVRRKWNPKSFETSTMISWVPKSLLKEIPDYYPVYSKRGQEIGRRSRWVMPDDEAGRAEVQRWFETTHKHLIEDVLRGGHDAVSGVVWNFDESAVHVHWMFDTMAWEVRDIVLDEHQRVLDDDGQPVMWHGKEKTLGKIISLTKDGRIAAAPEIAAASVRGIDGNGYLTDADGEHLLSVDGVPVRGSESLRVEAQQMWGQSEEVTRRRVVDGVEKDVVITGATKMREYQETYRERLLDAGFEIEKEVNPRGTSLKKGAYAALDAERVELEGEQEELYSREEDLDAWEARLESLESRLTAEQSRLEAARDDWEKRRPAVEKAAAAEAKRVAEAAWAETEKPRLEKKVAAEVAQEAADQARIEWATNEKPKLIAAAKAEGVKQADAALLETVIKLDLLVDEVYGREPDEAKIRGQYERMPLRPGEGLRYVKSRTETVLGKVERTATEDRQAAADDRRAAEDAKRQAEAERQAVAARLAEIEERDAIRNKVLDSLRMPDVDPATGQYRRDDSGKIAWAPVAEVVAAHEEPLLKARAAAQQMAEADATDAPRPSDPGDLGE